jgi:hypothetical protein
MSYASTGTSSPRRKGPKMSNQALLDRLRQLETEQAKLTDRLNETERRSRVNAPAEERPEEKKGEQLPQYSEDRE